METVRQHPGESSDRYILLAVADAFADYEYEKTRSVLETAGFTVKVAGSVRTTLTGMGGLQLIPDMVFDEVRIELIDGFLIIGGEGVVKYFWPHELLQKLVVSAYSAGKITGAICAAPPVLARAGLLHGLTATAYPFDEAIQEIQAGGGTYLNQPVVANGNLLTGRDPEATAEFAETACRLLNG